MSPVSRILRDRRFIAILLTGFSSGLPLVLVGGTLKYWLADSAIDIKTIGWFALVAWPYSAKPLWAPILDRAHLPLLGSVLGRRRGWGLAIQFALAGALMALGWTHPQDGLRLTAIFAVAVAFLSASQDIVIDALRIEMLHPSEYAFGGMLTGIGYRLAMLASSAGTLFIAQALGWKAAYTSMAALVSLGVLGLAIAPEPLFVRPAPGGFIDWWRVAVVSPFADFARRARWPLILAFIVLYKLGPVLALSLTSPFYHATGFTKDEVASVTKLFGLFATIAGGFAGVWIIRRVGLWRCLWWGGIAQIVALYPFAALAHQGHSIPLLALAVLSENVAGAVAATALGTYLAALCNKEFTATQFALLTALAALSGDTLSAPMGMLATAIGWQNFFLFTPLASLPGLLILWRLRRTMSAVDLH